MFSFLKKPKALWTKGRNCLRGLSAARSYTQEHIQALAQLFALELSTYLKKQTLRVILLLLGLCSLLFAYLAFWALAVALLAQVWCLVGALGVAFGLHLLVGLIFTGRALSIKAGPVAPETMRELKMDLQCLRPNHNDEKN